MENPIRKPKRKL